MAFLLSVMMMSFCSLRLQFGSCASVPEMLPTSIASGQVLATLDPFTNSHDNLSLTLFLRSENYLSLASLRRSQAHTYDINTTADFCEIDVGIGGVWNWRSGCAQISVGNSCSAALSKDGDLQVLDGSSVAWSSHTARKKVQFVELLNSGDLVLTDSSNAIIWKSSDNTVKEVCVAETPGSAPTTTSPAAAPPPSSPSSEGHPTPRSPSAAPPASSPGSEGHHPTPLSSPAAASPASSPSSEGHTLPSSPGAAPPSSSPSPEEHTMPPSPAAITPSSPSTSEGPSGSSSAPLGPEASVEGPAPASHSSASRLSVSGLRNSLTSQIIAILLSAGSLFLNYVV